MISIRRYARYRIKDNKKYYKVRWYRVKDALTFIILF